MSETVAIEVEPSATEQPFLENGSEDFPDVQEPFQYGSNSNLENLPGYSETHGMETTGADLGELFSKNPELPGIMLFEEDHFRGVISQNLYYKCVSRNFGREIYNRRSASIILEEATEQTLLLDSECFVQDAVDECLSRPRDSIYEPFLVHNQRTNRYRLCAFQVLLLASSQIASLRNHQMDQILNSVTDGLLVIDRDFRIGSEYSEITEKFFERTDLANHTILDILAPLIDEETVEQLKDYLAILFDPKLIDRLIKTINPVKQIPVYFAAMDDSSEERVKHFALNFERIRSNGVISQILIRVEDVTLRINMARELEQQGAAAEEKLHFVMQILQVEPADLNRFTEHFDQGLSEMIALVGEDASHENPFDTVHTLFRKAHTLKGEASFLKLSAHTQALHRLEDQLQKLRSATQLEAADFASLHPFLITLESLKEQVEQATEQLRSLGKAQNSRTSTSDSQSHSAGVDLIEHVAQMVEDLSSNLNKPVLFYTDLTNEDFPVAIRPALRDILIHLTRNSMVHGIEPVEERLARGKSREGAIQLAIKTHGDSYEIIFQDDGRGLNYSRIQARAQELGLNVSDEDALKLIIFEPGFSTADKVTELAGRGVGLDAIRDSVQRIGGRIVPHSEEGLYCAFQILLPLRGAMS